VSFCFPGETGQARVASIRQLLRDNNEVTMTYCAEDSLMAAERRGGATA